MLPIVPKPPQLFKSLTVAAVVAAWVWASGCATGRQAGGDQLSGVASFYSDALAGRLTANGERYDPQKATCAHRTLPFGTWLKVTLVDSGVTAHCRVNDRGPFKRGRVVDVSRSVADALGLRERGLAPVRLTVVPRPSKAGRGGA